MIDPKNEPDSAEAAGALARQALALARDIYPICRSITGNGVRDTLRRVAEVVPLEIMEVASGTPVFDWEIPKEWNIRDAFVADASGHRWIDFRHHNLHVMSYSTPVRRTMSLAELRPHLHTLPERPDWIPYRTSYYRETWGFCLAHSVLERMPEGQYEVVIDSDLAPGSLTYAEGAVRGESEEEFLVYTHVCHPSLANDNALGVAAAAVLAAALRRTRTRLTYRFVFAPGTIGSIAWLARNEALLPRIRAGLVLGLLGVPAPLTYKRSRRGRSEIDLIAATVVRELDPNAKVVEFSPYGYDERQFCSPGIDLPIGRVSRSSHGEFDEYHTSADNFQLVDEAALEQSLRAILKMIRRVDENRRFLSRNAKGEPRLGKRGLFRSTGGAGPGEFEHAMLWLMNQADGEHGINDTSAASGIPTPVLTRAAQALLDSGLLSEVGLETKGERDFQTVRSDRRGEQ